MVTLVGNETLYVLPVQTNGQSSATTEQIALNDIKSFVLTPAPFVFVDTVINTTANVTLSAAAISGGFISRQGPVAAFTDTTDTATAIINALAAFGGVPVGTSATLFIKNTTAFNETILPGSGVTITGSQTVITPYSTAVFEIQPTSASALTLNLTSIGSNLSSLPATGYNAVSTASSFTAAATTLAGATLNYLDLTGTLSTASNITMATAPAILAAVANGGLGLSFVLRIINDSSANFAWTVLTNTGITLTGTPTIAQKTWREFVLTATSGTTLTMQAVGTGTQS